MSSLAETISSALRAVGPATEDRLRDIIADFDGLNLSAEERLSAVATTVAATAATHHKRHKPVYLDAVRTWSLEIAQELKLRVPCVTAFCCCQLKYTVALPLPLAKLPPISRLKFWE